MKEIYLVAEERSLRTWEVLKLMCYSNREGLASIPEMQVYPLPGEEAKTESIRSRFQAMMEQEHPGGHVSAFDKEWEYDFEECQQLASDLKAMSESKARQAVLWIGEKIKIRVKTGALEASRDWAAWNSIYRNTGEGICLFVTRFSMQTFTESEGEYIYHPELNSILWDMCRSSLSKQHLDLRNLSAKEEIEYIQLWTTSQEAS